jgi:hypothetical protein
MELNCKKCGITLGNIDKARIKNNIIFLCANCWEKAKMAISLAEINTKQNKSFRNGNNSINDLMDMFKFK